MRARLKVSRAGVELIKSFEGLRSTAARLPDGRWTLGYGHTFSAREGATCTQEDADALLRFDLLPIVDAINNLVLVPLNQNPFDALVSFCFNIGVDNFAQSTVLKRINEGRMTEAALAMDAWRSAEFNGQTYVLAPLIRRRAAEKNLFLTPDDVTGNAPSLLVRPMEDLADAQPAIPSELNAPDRNGMLSAHPVGEAPAVMPTPVATPAAFDISASPQPVAQTVAQPVAQPVERQVIDLAAFAPRPVENAPVAPAPVAPAAILPPPYSASPYASSPTPYTYDTTPAMSPEIQAAIARAQEDQKLQEQRQQELRMEELRRQEQQLVEQRMREEAQRQAEMLAAARLAEEARQREEARLREEVRLQEFQRLEAQRFEQARIEEARLEMERQERERAQRDEMVRAELARLEQARFEQARQEELQVQARLDAERAERERLEREQQEFALRESARLEAMRIDAERIEREQAEAARLEQARVEQANLEQARLEQERERQEQQRLAQQRLDDERREAERQEQARVEAARAEQARLEQERLEQERLDRDRADKERLERERAEAEKANPQAAAPAADAASTEDAEKARKAEAAAALMRLYSPYGAGGLGRPLTPQPLKPAPVPQPVAQPAPQPMPAPRLVTPELKPAPVETPKVAEPEPDDEPLPSVVSFALKPAQSASNMPPPQITALNPYARPIPKDDAVVEVPRPKPVDLSAAPQVEATPQSDSLNWREQLQRPLPPGYQTSQSIPVQPAPVQAPQAAVVDASFEDSFGHDGDWTNGDGRVALTVDEANEEGASWWKMIRSTFWWILFSAMGLGCLGFAAATYYRARFDPNVARILGSEANLTMISVLSAAGGILFVCVSVWLIMKRLGGLKD